MSTVTNPLYGAFTDIVDALVGAPPSEPSLESWAIRAEEIFAQADMRLDANAYDPSVTNALATLTKRGIAFEPLSAFAQVSLRPRFVRIWARDGDHGVPYFNATDLLSIFALGFPSPRRYLSHATKTDIDGLVVREGWLVMSCSGTVGRVFYVPRRLDGWVATHDIMRIVANDPGNAGYLYAWLSTPLARAQMESRQHSTQVDHLTAEQVAELPVPVLPANDMASVNAQVMSALADRENAVEQLASAWPSP